MGSKYRVGCAQSHGRGVAWPDRRGGFSNKTLLAGLGILAAIALLIMLQAGDLGVPSFGKSAAIPSKSTSSSKSPQMILPVPDPLEEVAEEYIEQRQESIRQQSRTERETWQAIARMDERAAAAILSEMSDTEAVRILSKLRDRDLARILPQAHPQDAQEWVALLSRDLDLDAVPAEFEDKARAAGLPVNLDELLIQYGLAEETPTEVPVAGIDDDLGLPAIGEETTPTEGAAADGTVDPSAAPPEDTTTTDDTTDGPGDPSLTAGRTPAGTQGTNWV